MSETTTQESVVIMRICGNCARRKENAERFMMPARKLMAETHRCELCALATDARWRRATVVVRLKG